MPKPFETLFYWHDDAERTGPANMAVDEWLLASASVPVLRVYRWLPGWGSLGYFGSLAAAQNSFPGLAWVRRWTGGGTVDHRTDWTYTLVVPSAHPLAFARGAESYRLIHAALAQALSSENLPSILSTGTGETGAPSCFENPVCHDLVDADGRKIAGAGQRRSRQGLLHQGSVSSPILTLSPSLSPALPLSFSLSLQRTQALAKVLAEEMRRLGRLPTASVIDELAPRYADPKWTSRR